MSGYTDYQNAFNSRIDEAVDAFFARASTDPTRLYLYYCPAQEYELCGRLFPAAGATGGIEVLAHPEPIPSNRNRDGVRYWIHEKAKKLPILA